jgi:hypothetical protein
MLTHIENFYLQIVRVFFLITATVALLVFFYCIANAINARVPRENAFYATHYSELREKTSPLIYLKNLLNAKDYAEIENKIKLSKMTSTGEATNNAFSVNWLFLSALFAVDLKNEQFHSSYDRSLKIIQWSKTFDGKDKSELTDEKQKKYDVNDMVYSLESEFYEGINNARVLLQDKYPDKRPIYNYEKFVYYYDDDDTKLPFGWFHKQLYKEMQNLKPKLEKLNEENALRKASFFIYLYVAGGALAYFFLVMFYFLFVKIERNLRNLNKIPNENMEKLD